VVVDAPDGAPFPSGDEMEAEVHQVCDRHVQEYAASSKRVRAKAVISDYLGVTPEEWEQGEREFQCLASRPIDLGSDPLLTSALTS